MSSITDSITRPTGRRFSAAARCSVLLVTLGALSIPSGAADWPQWRGPNRNGISQETGWTYQWGASGPRRVWSKQVGEGFSSVAVANGRLYTMGYSGGQDTIWCLDANTGNVVWKYSYSCSSVNYAGPRATPVVDGDRVYTFSVEAHAYCLNATNGRMIWMKFLGRETRAQQPKWGFAGSPLIEGNLVIYNVGPAGVALDKTTGKIAWYSGTSMAGYASPIAYNSGGQRVVAMFSASGVAGVNPTNGRKIWAHEWQTDHGVNAADPVLSGTDVFISSNYGRGAALLRPGSGRAQVLWENRNMKNHFNSCVLLQGHLYGNDENTLKCLELSSGQEKWRLRGIGKGGLIASDGKLIVMTERGELVIIAATPGRYTELARAQVLDGTCWTHPVLANGRIYGRNHEGTLVCLDVRAR